MTQSGNQILVARGLPNVPVPGLYDLMFRRDGGQVDLWMDMRWDAPGCLLNDTGVTDPGATRDQGTGFWGTHFLTPETERYDLLPVRGGAQEPDLLGRAAR